VTISDEDHGGVAVAVALHHVPDVRDGGLRRPDGVYLMFVMVGSGGAAKMISGSRLGPPNSCRRCFASSRQCSLSERSSRSASCASDRAKRNPSHSALSAAVSGLLAGAEGRISRKIADFPTPTSRPALPNVVSAMLIGSAARGRC
jgi:hypothetical protein